MKKTIKLAPHVHARLKQLSADTGLPMCVLAEGYLRAAIGDDEKKSPKPRAGLRWKVAGPVVVPSKRRVSSTRQGSKRHR